MSDIFLEPNNSSSAVADPLMRYIINSSFFSPGFPLEMGQQVALIDKVHFLSSSLSSGTIVLQQGSGFQSSSVTRSGCLWQQTLTHIVSEDYPLIIGYSPGRTETARDTKLMERNYALIQLLRSWREGDKQEQYDTWEYLKRTLDEDRSSDRKLFP